MADRYLNKVLKGVRVKRCLAVPEVALPLYCRQDCQVNQNEFALQVDGVGSFFVRGGMEVQYSPDPDADKGWVRLYLNGQVLVALLHQQKIISFHASSFIYDRRGIMILGESGAGKSSLTAAFALKGAGMLTDDVTPVLFVRTEPHLKMLHGSIRIRANTAEQLNVGSEKLSEAEAGTQKKYLRVGTAGVKDFPLYAIINIKIGKVIKPEFDEPSLSEKFSLLRSEICMSDILAGMPETEEEYMHQLLEIVRRVRIIRVVRPADIWITDLHDVVEEFLITGKN